MVDYTDRRHDPGPRNPNDVLPYHACICNSHEDETRVREAQIRSTAQDSRCAVNEQSSGVSGKAHAQHQRCAGVWDLVIAGSNNNVQETLNFWKQLTHIMKYFRADEDTSVHLPKNFMQGFIEVSPLLQDHLFPYPNAALTTTRVETRATDRCNTLYRATFSSLSENIPAYDHHELSAPASDLPP